MTKMKGGKTREEILSRLVVDKSRVIDEDGFCGTVKYVGPVASAKNEKEIYAGIAWDDFSRGKHDGSVICRRTKQLVRHFSAKGGSFLRLNKLDFGVELDRELIQSKYVQPDAPIIAPNNLFTHTALTSSGKPKPIEFLGEIQLRKHQQLDTLNKISLRNMAISSIQNPIAGITLTNIHELDLAGNLFSDWEPVWQILHQFSSLKTLSLAANRIGNLNLTHASNTSERSFQNLQILNLHSCNISSVHTIQLLPTVFPSLTQICLAHNHLADLNQYNQLHSFDSLRTLDASSCNLDSWDQVAKLSSLPSLQTLLLQDNALQSINHEQGFEQLHSLVLTGTLLSEWHSIESISRFTSLKSLTLQKTPLTSQMGVAEVRFQLIARFPNIQVVNSSPVSHKERVEAERRYLALVSRELVLAGDDPKQQLKVLQKHPQFELLSEKLKHEMVSRSGAASIGGSQMHAVNVKIISMASASCHLEPLQKRLPASLTIERLKALCRRAFGLDLDLQALHYRTDTDAFPIELIDKDATLAYYGVCDGAEILMNEIDLEAKQREAKLSSEEFDRRVAKQEGDVMAMQHLQKDLRQKGML